MITEPITILTSDRFAELDSVRTDPIYASFSWKQFAAEQAAAHVLYCPGTAVTARCSLWVRGTVGVIGHYAAYSEEASSAVLNTACQWLKNQGCTQAIGPMNGNTWHAYRLVTYTDGSRPFLMEPTNPPEYPVWFEQNGFSETAGYYSKRGPMTGSFAKSDLQKAALERDGFTFRALRMNCLEEELGLLYDISVIAFSDNLYYEAISREAFVRQYLSYRDYLVPELIQLAFFREQPVGFMFVIPDYNEQADRRPVKTVIAKTIAVLPEYRKNHVGSVVLYEAYKAARAMGYREVITALIYDENVSGKMVEPGYSYCRKYTLYGKSLIG